MRERQPGTESGHSPPPSRCSPLPCHRYAPPRCCGTAAVPFTPRLAWAPFAPSARLRAAATAPGASPGPASGGRRPRPATTAPPGGGRAAGGAGRGTGARPGRCEDGGGLQGAGTRGWGSVRLRGGPAEEGGAASGGARSRAHGSFPAGQPPVPR